MTRAVLALVVAGCGRIAFAPLDDRGLDDASSDVATVDPSVRLWLAFEDPLFGGALDSSAAAAHASCQPNCPVRTPNGRYGGGAVFDSMGSALQAPVNMPAVDFTWTVWVRLAMLQPFSAILSIRGDGTNPGGAEVALVAGMYQAWTNGSAVDSGDGVTAGAWTHVAFVRTPSQILQYLDGVVVNTSSDSVAHDFAGCPLLIGVDSDMGCLGGLNGYLDADLDEVRVYGRALSAAEIAADMASATPVPPP